LTWSGSSAPQPQEQGIYITAALSSGLLQWGNKRAGVESKPCVVQQRKKQNQKAKNMDTKETKQRQNKKADG
jgi:hypothetical protein